MPRYFFDVLDGDQATEDEEGVEFAALDGAVSAAIQGARDIVAHGIMRNEDFSAQSFRIRDSEGNTAATLPFREALPGRLRETS
jgi:hypothetical protein